MIFLEFSSNRFLHKQKMYNHLKNKQFLELQICPLILSEMMRRNGFRDLHALHNLTNNIFLRETVQNVHIFCDRLFDRNAKKSRSNLLHIHNSCLVYHRR